MPRAQVRLMRKGSIEIAATGLGLLLAIMLAGCSSLESSYEARLADHLTEIGAKMYGAYWCPYCATQKDYFGGAASRLPYVECDPEGFGAQVELCDAAGVEVYPTWIIGGDRYLGAQPLGDLATLSGFDLPAEDDAQWEGTK